MPHLIGYVDDSNGTLAHYNLLATIKDFTSANGWQVLRYDDSIENRELVLKTTGYSTQEEIFVIFHCYQSATSDIYNLAVGVSLGYVAGNPISTQPNVIFSGIPTHNRRIDYWLTLNPQRIAGALKVGTPVYETFYAGKFLPHAKPHQYPLPMICAGMLYDRQLVRFSDTGHSMPFKGSRANLRMWFNDGAWKQPDTHPWNNSNLTVLRDTGGSYAPLPITLGDATGIYGELDGVAYISGFDNVTENTLTLDGDTWVIIQDVYRNGFADYIALKMDN